MGIYLYIGEAFGRVEDGRGASGGGKLAYFGLRDILGGCTLEVCVNIPRMGRVLILDLS